MFCYPQIKSEFCGKKIIFMYIYHLRIFDLIRQLVKLVYDLKYLNWFFNIYYVYMFIKKYVILGNNFVIRDSNNAKEISIFVPTLKKIDNILQCDLAYLETQKAMYQIFVSINV